MTIPARSLFPGFRLVPEALTVEMHAAMKSAVDNWHRSLVHESYAAAIAAAPEPPIVAAIEHVLSEAAKRSFHDAMCSKAGAARRSQDSRHPGSRSNDRRPSPRRTASAGRWCGGGTGVRRLAAIEADIGRYNRVLDAAIDLVVKDKARPTRAWAMACRTLQDRIGTLEDELRDAQSSARSRAPGG